VRGAGAEALPSPHRVIRPASRRLPKASSGGRLERGSEPGGHPVLRRWWASSAPHRPAGVPGTRLAWAASRRSCRRVHEGAGTESCSSRRRRPRPRNRASAPLISATRSRHTSGWGRMTTAEIRERCPADHRAGRGAQPALEDSTA
jgi:hypothetical protein